MMDKGGIGWNQPTGRFNGSDVQACDVHLIVPIRFEDWREEKEEANPLETSRYVAF